MSRSAKEDRKLGFGEMILVAILGALALLIGPAFTFFASMALKDIYYQQPALGQINEERAQIRSWPSVTGRLDKVELHSVTTHGKYSGPDYCLVNVKYHYAVDGKKYSGDRLRRVDCDNDFSYKGLSSWKQVGEAGALENSRIKLARFLGDSPDHEKTIDKDNHLYSFFPDRPVPVFFDRKMPANSMLDNDLAPLNWWDYYGWPMSGPLVGLLIGILCCWPHIAFIAAGLISIINFFSGKANHSLGKTAMSSSHSIVTDHHGENIVKIPTEEQWKIEATQDKPASSAERE